MSVAGIDCKAIAVLLSLAQVDTASYNGAIMTRKYRIVRAPSPLNCSQTRSFYRVKAVTAGDYKIQGRFLSDKWARKFAWL